MSARAKRPTTKPPPIPKAARPALEDQTTSIFDSGNFKKEAATPIRTISMKTPADVDAAPREDRPIRQVKLRAISEVTPLPHAQPKNLGYLAPPRDASEVRARQLRDYVIWGCVAIMIASVIALVIWFAAR